MDSLNFLVSIFLEESRYYKFFLFHTLKLDFFLNFLSKHLHLKTNLHIQFQAIIPGEIVMLLNETTFVKFVNV